jgi:hypothetical protein
MRLPVLCLVLLLSTRLAQAQLAADPGQICRAAIAVVERERGIPARLMQAISRVESGRRDPQTGRFAAWPWTINAEGRGSFYPDKAAAIAAVRALQAQGVRSIDVGCMQVNLRHHANAFATLEEAFDPLTNARYAARFLTELQSASGDWMRAAGAYHSQTPEHAEPYRARVAAAWLGERDGPEPSAAALAALRMPANSGGGGAGGGGAMLSNGAERMAPPSISPGIVGRGLDAYRAMPITLASRTPAMVLRRF